MWSGIDCYHSRRWDVHDVVQSELDISVLEEFQDPFGVLEGGRYSILFPPLGDLGDDIYATNISLPSSLPQTIIGSTG